MNPWFDFTLTAMEILAWPLTVIVAVGILAWAAVSTKDDRDHDVT